MPSPSPINKVQRIAANVGPITSCMPSDAHWGIDTVRISFVVSPEHCDLHARLWPLVSTRNLRDDLPEAETLVRDVQYESAAVRTTLYTARNICMMHFNAARMVSPKSSTLLPPAAFRTLVYRLLEDQMAVTWPHFVRISEDGELVWQDDWAEHVRIKRIDIARNLSIADPEAVKIGLRAARARNMKTQHEYTDANGGWTLENKTARSGTDRIYDKSADLARWEVEERLLSGTPMFRFESQVQRDRLERLGLRRLSEITDERVWQALEERWDATGWGSPLPGRTDLFGAVKGLSVAVQEGLLGYLVLAESGDTAHMSRSHVAERKRLAKSLGLTPGTPVDLLGAPDRRIDLRAGCIVPMAKAEVEILPPFARHETP